MLELMHRIENRENCTRVSSCLQLKRVLSVGNEPCDTAWPDFFVFPIHCVLNMFPLKYENNIQIILIIKNNVFNPGKLLILAMLQVSGVALLKNSGKYGCCPCFLQFTNAPPHVC